jgi:hypothetical protein
MHAELDLRSSSGRDAGEVSAAGVEALPFVDELSTEVGAGPEATWDSLLRVAEGTVSSRAAEPLARLLGAADVGPSGPRPLVEGSAFTGFHVAGAVPERELALAGSHRFSRYSLIFRIEPGDAETRLKAETRAEFPGLKGSVYRALVIGTRGHILVTRRILDSVRRRAERTA